MTFDKLNSATDVRVIDRMHHNEPFSPHFIENNTGCDCRNDFTVADHTHALQIKKYVEPYLQYAQHANADR